MNSVAIIKKPEVKNRIDLAALLLLATALVVSTLYPEIFISGGFTLFGSHKLVPLTVLLPFFAAGAAGYIFFRRHGIKAAMLDAVILAFLSWLVARSIVTPGGTWAIKLFVYGAGSFYMAALVTRRGRCFSAGLLWIAVCLTAVTVIYGLIEYGTQTNLIFHNYIQDKVADPQVGLHRIGSTLAHPVAYAAFLIQMIPFCILAWVRASSFKIRVLLLLVTSMAGLALFLTYSKGSWIVSVVLGATVALILQKHHRRKVMISAVAVLSAILLLTGIFWQEINLEMSARANQSVNTRLVTWSSAIDGIKHNWLLGVGLGQGNDEMRKPLAQEWQSEVDTLVVDNYYLMVFLEQGVIGIVLWLAVMAFLIWEGIVLSRRREVESAWGMAALASTAGLLMNAVTFDALLVWPNYVLFWMASGVLHGTAWRGSKGVRDDPSL